MSPAAAISGVPIHALAEWRALQLGLATFRPSCQFAPDEWYELPKSKTQSNEVRHQIAAVCGRCPLASACLAYALAANERYGCWGGVWMDRPSERRRFTNDSREAA